MMCSSMTRALFRDLLWEGSSFRSASSTDLPFQRSLVWGTSGILFSYRRYLLRKSVLGSDSRNRGEYDVTMVERLNKKDYIAVIHDSFMRVLLHFDV
jgi:hypothetical protein